MVESGLAGQWVADIHCLPVQALGLDMPCCTQIFMWLWKSWTQAPTLTQQNFTGWPIFPVPYCALILTSVLLGVYFVIFPLCGSYFWFYFLSVCLWQGLTMSCRLTPNSWFSCFHLQSAEITGVCHHAKLTFLKSSIFWRTSIFNLIKFNWLIF